MKRRITAFALALLTMAVFGLTGCAQIQKWWASPIQEEDDENPEEDLAVLPFTEKSERTEKVTLFFQYLDEPYLADDTRNVTIKANERIESIVIEELIRGPSSDKADLQPLFQPDTKVLGVSDNQKIFFVTLSKEFLSVPAEVPSNWEQDEQWAEEIYRQRRLAIQSLVCAITEMGKYSQVQIQVDVDGSGEGKRITRKEAGFTGNNEDNVLGPQTRPESLLLTPSLTVKTALNYFSRKEWGSLYQYVAAQDTSNIPRPSLEDMESTFSANDITLREFQVLSEHVSGDGQRATVSISYSIRTSDGQTRESAATPVRLVRENEVWKIAYPALENLFLDQ